MKNFQILKHLSPLSILREPLKESFPLKPYHTLTKFTFWYPVTKPASMPSTSNTLQGALAYSIWPDQSMAVTHLELPAWRASLFFSKTTSPTALTVYSDMSTRFGKKFNKANNWDLFEIEGYGYSKCVLKFSTTASVTTQNLLMNVASTLKTQNVVRVFYAESSTRCT